MWTYTHTDELYHYGVLGMKWGKRNPKVESAKKAYKKAKRNYREARKDAILPNLTGYGIQGIANANKANARLADKRIERLNAKVKYKTSKISDPTKAAKKEFKMYSKEMHKSGLVGSVADSNSGGRSTRLYNELKVKKGKAYADKVQKSVERKSVSALVGTAAVVAGSTIALALLEDM